MHLWNPVDGRRGDQVKNGENSDGSGWLQGEGKGIHRNWMSTAITSISVIRVQTVFQTGVWFYYKCSRQTGFCFWRKLGFRQHFGVLFSIPIFCKNTKGETGWGVIGSLSFDVQGGEGGLAQFGPIRTDRKRGEAGCKNWTFFLDVIYVWSLTRRKREDKQQWYIYIILFEKWLQNIRHSNIG